MYADRKHGDCLVTSGIFLVPKQTAVWSVNIQPIKLFSFLSELECTQMPYTRPTDAHIILILHYHPIPYNETKL